MYPTKNGKNNIANILCERIKPATHNAKITLFLYSIAVKEAKTKVNAQTSPTTPRTYKSTNQYGVYAATIVPTTAGQTPHNFFSQKKQKNAANKYPDASVNLKELTKSKPHKCQKAPT